MFTLFSTAKLSDLSCNVHCILLISHMFIAFYYLSIIFLRLVFVSPFDCCMKNVYVSALCAMILISHKLHWKYFPKIIILAKSSISHCRVDDRSGTRWKCNLLAMYEFPSWPWRFEQGVDILWARRYATLHSCRQFDWHARETLGLLGWPLVLRRRSCRHCVGNKFNWLTWWWALLASRGLPTAALMVVGWCLRR